MAHLLTGDGTHEDLLLRRLRGLRTLSLASSSDSLAVTLGIPLLHTPRFDRVDVVNIHSVNLFQCPVLGLDDEEEHNRNESQTAASEHEAV